MARRTKEAAEETRHSILAAALDVFSERGYSRATFVDIAKRIGMSKGAVYWHFRDKPSLLAALIQEMHEREEALLAEEVPEVVTLEDLKAYFLARTRILTQDTQCRKFGFFVLLQMEWSAELIAAVREEMMRFREEPFEEVQHILARAKQRGAIVAHVDLTAAKEMLVGMWLGLLLIHFQGISLLDPVEAADTAFEALIARLRP